jgi:uncharacterized protein YgiB involved in biofilm formation
MKRTRTLALTGLMAAGGFTLSACDNPADHVRIEHPGKATDAYAYQSLQDCLAKDEVPDDVCQKAEKNAADDSAKAARYDQQSTCEDVYGPGQCVPRQYANNGGGGSFWGPLITGFVVGRMMDGGWGGRGLYRDWRSGGYYTVGGGRVWTDYSTGRSRIGAGSFNAPTEFHGPPKTISRAGVISRGGFGGRMSGRSYGGGFGGGHGFGG